MWALVASLPTAVGLQGMVPCWGGPSPSPAHPVPSALPNGGYQGWYHHIPLLEHPFQLQLRTIVLRAPKRTYSLGGHHPPWHMHST